MLTLKQQPTSNGMFLPVQNDFIAIKCRISKDISIDLYDPIVAKQRFCDFKDVSVHGNSILDAIMYLWNHGAEETHVMVVKDSIYKFTLAKYDLKKRELCYYQSAVRATDKGFKSINIRKVIINYAMIVNMSKLIL